MYCISRHPIDFLTAAPVRVATARTMGEDDKRDENGMEQAE